MPPPVASEFTSVRIGIDDDVVYLAWNLRDARIQNQ